MSVLETEVRNTDPGTRARALALLVEHAGSGWGAVALADPSAWVQRQGVEALAVREDPESRALLLSCAAERNTDPYVRGAAAVHAGGEDAAELMRDALRTESEGWRIAPLALALLRLGDTTARDPLARALATGELALEVDFVLEVGASRDPLLLPALQLAEERAEPELVLPIAAARLMLGDAAGEHALRKAIAEGDVERQLEAIDYLARVDHPAADTLLRRAESGGAEIAVSYARLVLAARTGDAAPFVDAARDEDPEIRALAATVVRSSPSAAADRSVARAFDELLIDTDPTVRAEAARSAGELSLTEVRGPVSWLLDDPLARVRTEAAGAMLALEK
jgi:hypothetical protein